MPSIYARDACWAYPYLINGSRTMLGLGLVLCHQYTRTMLAEYTLISLMVHALC